MRPRPLPAPPGKRVVAGRVWRVCQRTGKVRYPNETEARRALDSTLKARVLEGDLTRGETRYYRCPDCRDWHLTSQLPPRPTDPARDLDRQAEDAVGWVDGYLAGRIAGIAEHAETLAAGLAQRDQALDQVRAAIAVLTDTAMPAGARVTAALDVLTAATWVRDDDGPGS